jgi:2-oxoglutarate ferredoxin oxidoreductase subunit delta
MPWIIVNENRCKGCGLCINFCPKKVLGTADHLNPKGYYPVTMTDKSNCIGCAICARVCPDVALSVYKEDDQKA